MAVAKRPVAPDSTPIVPLIAYFPPLPDGIVTLEVFEEVLWKASVSYDSLLNVMAVNVALEIVCEEVVYNEQPTKLAAAGTKTSQEEFNGQ